MSFANEKRRVLGLLALLAPFPLPFNGNLGWPVLIVYLAAIVVFWIRVRSGNERWLPDWALNVLGGIYLPILGVDLVAWGRGGLLRPILHLSLFVIVVKLWSLKRERDKWQVLVAVLFVFFSAMGTSVHPAAVAYMLTMIALLSLALMRFAQYSLLTGLGPRHTTVAHELPAPRIALVATLVAAVLSIPVFALLPRVSTPFLLGRGQGTGTTVQTSGFTDIVTLDVVGSIRQSREVVLRIEDSPLIAPEDLRLKAATYGFYDGRSWRREPGGKPLFRDDRTQGFVLTPIAPGAEVRAWLQPLGSNALPLPLQAVRLNLPGIPTLEEDPGGGIRTWFPLTATTELTLGLTATPRALEESPAPTLLMDPRYLAGLTPRMQTLADEVAGSGSSHDRALRLEQHLATQFEYTTEFVGVSGPEAIDEFLFEHRRGHCEYFASALVVLLRSQGIPSRLVTGFLGGERSPLEGYVVVRQLSAHAWVEAWDEEARRWIALDPTPAEGRPRLGTDSSLAGLFRDAWDFVLFRWDRYVLSFGFEDQLELVRSLRQMLEQWLAAVKSQGNTKAAETTEGVPPPTEDVPTASGESTGSPWRGRIAVVAVLLGAIGIAAMLWLRPRRALQPDQAYRGLQRQLAARHAIASVPPLELERLAIEEFPELHIEVRRIVRTYIATAFAGMKNAPEPGALERSLAAIRARKRGT